MIKNIYIITLFMTDKNFVDACRFGEIDQVKKIYYQKSLYCRKTNHRLCCGFLRCCYYINSLYNCHGLHESIMKCDPHSCYEMHKFVETLKFLILTNKIDNKTINLAGEYKHNNPFNIESVAIILFDNCYYPTNDIMNERYIIY